MTSNGDNYCTDKSDAVVSKWRESEPVTSAILRAVSKKENIEFETVEPLYQHIEPEALNALLTHSRSRNKPLTIKFTFNSCQVIISQDGKICISNN